MQTSKYEHFYNTDLITSIKRMIICFAVGIPALITLFISKNNSYWVVLIFKQWLPPTLSFLYLFGFSKLVALKFGLINLREAKYVKSGSVKIDEQILQIKSEYLIM